MLKLCKKNVVRAVVGSLCCLLFMGEPAYAGSLNANEQELAAIIKGTYTYHGVTYKVKDTYIQIAIDYLLQDDIDVTDEQKQKAINKMYSSIQQGIDEGYLEPVGEEVPGKSPGSKGGDVKGAGEGTGTDSPGSVHAGDGGNEAGAEAGDASEAAGTGSGSIAEIGGAAEEAVKSPENSALEQYADSGNDFCIPTEKSVEEFLHIPSFPWEPVRCAMAAVTAGGVIFTAAAVRTKLFIHKKKKKRGIPS